MSTKNLAVVFAPTIMRDHSLDRELTDMLPKNDVIEFVIKNSHEIFGGPWVIDYRWSRYSKSYVIILINESSWVCCRISPRPWIIKRRHDYSPPTQSSIHTTAVSSFPPLFILIHHCRSLPFTLFVHSSIYHRAIPPRRMLYNSDQFPHWIAERKKENTIQIPVPRFERTKNYEM